MKLQILWGVTLAVAALSAIPAQAGSFRARNGATVNTVNAAVFEVVPRGTAAGPSYWCAAADYAQRGLRAAWTAKIYIARGLGPSATTGRRSAVQFTMDPQAAGVTPTPPSLSINSLRAGDSMSVQQAASYCNTDLGRR
jgi:hypothetical protein